MKEGCSQNSVQTVKAKSLQNIYYKLFLQATGNKQLGEGNPNDGYFGIALRVKDCNAWDLAKWVNNLLGKTLMEIMSELKQVSCAEPCTPRHNMVTDLCMLPRHT